MDFRDGLQTIKENMIEREEVFEAIKRGYPELSISTNAEILDYFDSSSTEELRGHVSNIKGILFEQEVQDKLTASGIESNIFEETNHPITDLQIIENGEVLEELQLKATDSSSYINETLLNNPDINIIATSEIATSMNRVDVINSDISNSLLEETVIETISPIPSSVEGLLIRGGLAFLTGGLLF